MSGFPYAYQLSDKTLTVVIDNKPYQTDRSNPHWEQIKEALKDPATTADRLIGLLKPINAIASAMQGRNRITVHNGRVFFDGVHPVSNALAVRILDIINEDLDVEPWIRFANNVYSNPNEWSRDELYLFLERADLPITPDGCFIAYKKVTADYKDCYSNSIDNRIGRLVTMPGGRQQVDPNRNNTCSVGLHFCSKEYLRSFGGARTLLVKINPADVVSIPNDYNNSKGRTWRYEVVGEIVEEAVASKTWGAVSSAHDEHQWGPSESKDEPDEELDPIEDEGQDDPIDEVKVVIETVGNGSIDRNRFNELLAQHGTLRAMARACGVSEGTVQSWKTKLTK